MQIFPDYTSSSVSALGGVSVSSSSSVVSSTNEFLDSLNRELAASGRTPVVDTSANSGCPTGFRSVNQDASSKLDSEDVNSMLEKLRKKGVDDSALAGIEGLLATGATLTLGNIMGTLRKGGRATGELSEEEMNEITSALQKMQFSKEDADEILGLMEGGHGGKALRLIRARAAELGEDGFSLTNAETRALMRGLDLSENAMAKFASLLGTGEEAGIGGKTLDKLLGPAAEELAAKQAEAEKLAAELKGAIDEALREKKIRERNELVADTRGNGLTDRAERRMRDDLTARANGFGKSREEREEEALLEEDLAREQDNNARKQSLAEERRTVSARDSGLGKNRTETSPSQAREAFSSVVNRMDVSSGMTVPTEAQTATPQQNTSAAFTHRQEVFSQVEQGLLRQLADGTRQMTLRLDPAELGQLTVVLSVKGGEVRALIRAENPETTAALADQMDQLRATLEDQGFKVTKLDVETQLPHDTTKDQWSDMTQFNREQEMREQERFLRIAKLRRESGETLARDVQSTGIREEISASGLHIIA